MGDRHRVSEGDLDAYLHAKVYAAGLVFGAHVEDPLDLRALDPGHLDRVARYLAWMVAVAEIAGHGGDRAAATAYAGHRLVEARKDQADLAAATRYADTDPPAAGGPHTRTEENTMGIFNKQPEAPPVPEHLRDDYTAVGWPTIERHRRAWEDRTPEHARTSAAWATAEHDFRLAEAQRRHDNAQQSAQRMREYAQARLCACCAARARDSIHDELCGACRALIAQQETDHAGDEVLDGGGTRRQAVAEYRTGKANR